MKIAVGVGGIFHADRMVKALLERHDVSLFTSYPGSRFVDLPKQRIRSFLAPEIGYRALKSLGAEIVGEHFKMRSFGKSFALDLLSREPVDLLISWSSFALEAFKASSARKVLVRDSAHIKFAESMYVKEYERFRIPYPNKKIGIQRELEEYERADAILVLSKFAKISFLEQGISADKIHVVRLGVNTSLFQPKPANKIELPLKVVYFGGISLRKGVHYLLEATQGFSKKHIQLTLIGAISPEFRPLLAKYSHAEVKAPMPHHTLSECLRTQDVFVFPTVHDGFGQTLIQAMASGLVPVVTRHCGAAELVREGENGFIIPAGDAHAITDRLESLLAQPKEIPRLSGEATKVRLEHGWERYSLEMLQIIENLANAPQEHLRSKN